MFCRCDEKNIPAHADLGYKEFISYLVFVDVLRGDFGPRILFPLVWKKEKLLTFQYQDSPWYIAVDAGLVGGGRLGAQWSES